MKRFTWTLVALDGTVIVLPHMGARTWGEANEHAERELRAREDITSITVEREPCAA